MGRDISFIGYKRRGDVKNKGTHRLVLVLGDQLDALE